MAQKVISPARAISGAVVVPGDKSISHRYAILAAFAEGRSRIDNFSKADDCRRTLDCLRRIGVSIDEQPESIEVSCGLAALRAPRSALDAGNSGTTMRLLAGVLAGQNFTSTLTGDASLCRRPMRRVIEPLSQMGARIRARDSEFAPLEIVGAPLHPIDYTLRVASAQVKSAILLAGLFADGSTSVTEPIPTRDHLELALAEFGADVRRTGSSVSVGGRPRLKPRHVAVPGDLSAAVFFLAAAAILPEANLLIHNVGLNPTRTAALDFLASMGGLVSLLNVQMRNGELVGDIAVRHAELEGGVVSGPAVAAMIDELPMLAALGPYTRKGIEIRDAAELRVKESDRIAVLAQSLRDLGASVEELPDGLRVGGRGESGGLRGARVVTQGDHRMAMALAVAALGAKGDTWICDADCVAVSFPEFFATLERVIER